MTTLATDSAESGGNPLKKHTVGEVLGVIVAGGYRYTRDDGVQVVPLTALGP